jgi:ABC-type bacteriocin/lantibiotic exporter with double-glycine peptidase domain
MPHDRPPAVAIAGLDAAAGEVPACRIPATRIALPPVKQHTHFSCGAAATLSLLRYWSWARFSRVDEAALFHALGTTIARGTEPEPMVDYLRSAGVAADYRHGDVTVGQLERAVDAGQPPIVDLQAWRDTALPWRETWDAGHYVILVAYDAERLFVMDPSIMTPGAYAFLPRAELDPRWHDLAGPDDVHLERMAIFARGRGPRWVPDEPVETTATRLL